MSKHSRCFICGGGQEEVLTSVPDLRTHTSIALCSVCWSMPANEIAHKVDRIREAMKKARQEAGR